MEEKVNFTTVGMIVLLLFVSLVVTGLWLSVGLEKKKHKLYLVYMREAVSGLSNEAQVKFNGVPVGYVKQISLDSKNPQKVRLLLSIEVDTPITTSTTATLIPHGITGNVSIGLNASSTDLTPLKKKPNEPYPVIPAKPSLYGQLDKVLGQLSTNINAVTVDVRKIFNDENANIIKQILTNTKTFTHTVAMNSKPINRGIHHADVVLANLAKVSNKFPVIVNDLHTGIKKFEQMATTVTKAGGKVSDTMQAGKNTLNRISGEAVTPLATLFSKLNTILANLEIVSSEMRQNPAVIIRGTKPPTPGPGEESA